MAGKKEKVNLLNAVPVRSRHITTQWKGENAVLAFPRFKRAWVRRLLLPKGMSPDIHITLEEHGSAVWNLIDGQRTVQEIITLLTGQFPDEADYPSRIARYMVQLQREGMVQLFY